jgi:GT2 family glycosyltransferase
MKCDIVIPVWNQLELTKSCVDSVVKYTEDVDYRLVIIDNASGGETKDYLEGLKSAIKDRVLLIRNQNNLGFVRAVNQGMRLSQAPYVCLLNNDTLVTAGWLSEMIKVAASSPRIGLVNPSSNNLGQRPLKNEAINTFASRLKTDSGKYIELGAAIGFCMFIKKEVIDKIGVFDEIYGMGLFEDTDYSRRAVKEGYICARAVAAYVWHKEGTSFGRSGAFDENFERNRQIFEFRWGKRRWIAYVLDGADDLTLAKFGRDALVAARKGFWIWSFSKKHLDLPAHSNIIAAEFGRNFYANTLFKILFKKKRFSEVYVTREAFANVLKTLSFIHKAKVYPY